MFLTTFNFTSLRAHTCSTSNIPYIYVGPVPTSYMFNISCTVYVTQDINTVTLFNIAQSCYYTCLFFQGQWKVRDFFF